MAPPRFLYVFLISGDLGEPPGTMDDLITEIQAVDQTHALQTFSAINAFFQDAHWNNRPGQLQVVDALLPERARIAIAGKLGSNPTSVFFSPVQLLLLEKLAILHGRHPGSGSPLGLTPERLYRLLRWANDNSQPGVPPGAVHDGSPNRERGWAAVNSIWPLIPEASLRGLLYRSHHMYVTLARRLGPEAGFDLENVLLQALGLVPRDYFALGFACLVKWIERAGSILENRPPELDRIALFEESAVSSDHAECFFSSVACTVPELAEHIRTLEDSVPLVSRYLAIAKHPLIQLDERRLCILDPTFLEASLTSGMYHKILLHNDARVRSAFLNFNGQLFQAYVAQVFESMFPHAPGLAQRCLIAPRHGHGELVDVLLDSSPRFLMFETKASRVRQDVFVSGSLDEYLDEFNLKFVTSGEDRPKGFGQLARAAEVLGHEGLPEHQIPSIRGENLIPVMITAQSLPQSDYLWAKYDDLIRTAFPTFLGRTQPPQMLDINELEILESLVSQGHSLTDVLSERAGHPDRRSEAFRHGPFPQPSLALLSDRQRSLLDVALDDFRLRLFPNEASPL